MSVYLHKSQDLVFYCISVGNFEKGVFKEENFLDNIFQR